MAAFLMMAAACTESGEVVPDGGVERGIPPLDASGPSTPICRYVWPTQYHSGTISAPQTWSGAEIHVVTGDLKIQAPVTIGTCAIIEVADGKTIEVDALGGGSLTTLGADTFQPWSTAWGQLRVNGGAVTLNNTTVAGTMGPAAVSLESGSLNLQSVAITNSAGIGLRVSGGSLDPTSNDVAISGAAVVPASVYPNMVGALPRGAYTGNGKDEVVVELAPNNVVSTSATWKNLGVPYHISGGSGATLDVAGASGTVAVLTLEAGTTLKFDPLTGLRVDPIAGKTTSAASGALVAVGNATQRITFTSASSAPKPGDWMALYFGGIVDSRTRLDYGLIDYAGGTDTATYASCPTPFTYPNFVNDAEIRFESGKDPTRELVTNTVFENSATNAIDRGYQHDYSYTPIDFTATNTFINIPYCWQTHSKNIFNGCPSIPQCN